MKIANLKQSILIIVLVMSSGASYAQYLQPDKLDALGRTVDPELLLQQKMGVIPLPTRLINNQSYGYASQNPITHIDPWGLVDLNLTPNTPANNVINTFLNNTNPAGLFSVGGHGNPNSLGGLTPQQLADLINQNGGTGGKPVILYSCSTGGDDNSDDGDGDPFAQQLADILQSPVIAPTQNLGVYPDHAYVQNGGTWGTFNPK